MIASTSPKRSRALPGIGLSLGYTWLYLTALVVIPVGGLMLTFGRTPWRDVWAAVSAPRTLAAYGLSFGAALAAALICAPLGLIVAWVLARYRFPGRALLDAMVDLPFALPTSVSGITLTFVYSPDGWLGRLVAPLGINVAFTRLGITAALVFVGFPFVVRAVQPVIQDLDPALEEAAACLGASRWETFRRVFLPTIVPALLAGSTLAFARGLGEYGSVVFIAGNMPMHTEIAPLLIITKLEAFDYAGATAIAVGMLAVSLGLLLVMNSLQQRMARRAFGA